MSPAPPSPSPPATTRHHPPPNFSRSMMRGTQCIERTTCEALRLHPLLTIPLPKISATCHGLKKRPLKHVSLILLLHSYVVTPLSSYHVSKHLHSLQNRTLAFASKKIDYNTLTSIHAAPKRGSIVETYQTVSVNCNICRHRLFRYKKKNGTKSNLIKCYVERIVHCEDPVLQKKVDGFETLDEDHKWECPECGTGFARAAMIRGLPALKLVGGKTRMTKK